MIIIYDYNKPVRLQDYITISKKYKNAFYMFILTYNDDFDNLSEFFLR